MLPAHLVSINHIMTETRTSDVNRNTDELRGYLFVPKTVLLIEETARDYNKDALRSTIIQCQSDWVRNIQKHHSTPPCRT